VVQASGIILSPAVVAERYTRRSQKPLGASPWGFESPLRHPNFVNKWPTSENYRGAASSSVAQSDAKTDTNGVKKGGKSG
jgi:hypothetical protein